MKELTVKGLVTVEGMKFHEIEGGFGEGKKSILVKEIAEIHDKKPKHINELINNNKDEFLFEVDILDLKNNESAENNLKTSGVYTQNALNGSKHLYILSESGYLKLYSLMKHKNEKIVNFIVNDYFNSNKELVVFTQNKEIRFLDMLEESLKPFNITGVRQYNILGYRIDYYIPSLNIAIEYDENGHKNYSYEKHEGRQKEIENKLDCRFIRVTDSDSHSFNVGKVIKEMFNI